MLDSKDTSKTEKSQMPMLQTMELGGILDNALSLYRNNFRFFLAIIAIYIGLVALQEAVVIWLLERHAAPNLDNLISDVDSLLDNLVYMFCVGIFVIASSSIYLGRPLTFRGASHLFCSQFSVYLGGSLLFLIPYTILTVDSIGMWPLRGAAQPTLFAFFVCILYLLGFLRTCYIAGEIYSDGSIWAESILSSRDLDARL